jgi:molybdate transport system ATP-binding protein
LRFQTLLCLHSVNRLPARVVVTQEINPSHLLVRLEPGDGQFLLSRITRWSGKEIGLQEGMHLYAQVKSVALMA